MKRIINSIPPNQKVRMYEKDFLFGCLTEEPSEISPTRLIKTTKQYLTLFVHCNCFNEDEGFIQFVLFVGNII